jgi:hypothetical protein
MRSVFVGTLSFACFASSCVFDVAVGHAQRQAQTAEPGPPSGAVDILFVVDNSGSMLEEQERLSRTLFNEACPIQSLAEVPDTLRHPDDELLARLTQVCGFAQLLAAFDRDFRIGVITTDVDACDNLISVAQGGDEWGHRPQRGCLQPVPTTGQRFIQRSDVDPDNRFRELLSNLGTYGSPFERPFDAVQAFLDGDTFAEACEGDRDAFLRDEASLLLVFVSDEDDCSHADGRFGFDDETSAICGNDASVVIDHNPALCYDAPELLAPVEEYADRWRALKGEGREDDVRVALLVGSVLESGEAVPSGCLLDDTGAVSDQCIESRGLSNATGPGEPCDPDALGQRCCAADAGNRYFELASRLASDSAARGSVCAPSYVSTVLGGVRLEE